MNSKTFCNNVLRKMIRYSPFMYLYLPNAELEQINEQKDVAVTTLNAPSLAEICLAIGRRQQEDNLIKKQGGNF